MAKALNVRLPEELHQKLSQDAEQQGISLNTLIVALLASGSKWRRDDS